MKICVILLFTALFACKKQKENTFQADNNQEVIVQNNMVTNDSLLPFSRNKAIEKFGVPIEQHKMLLDNMYGEFYVNIYYKFTEDERQSESIFIEEITWEKDSINNLTIWYEHKNNNLNPKAFLIWGKGSEF